MVRRKHRNRATRYHQTKKVLKSTEIAKHDRNIYERRPDAVKAIEWFIEAERWTKWFAETDLPAEFLEEIDDLRAALLAAKKVSKAQHVKNHQKHPPQDRAA